MCSPAWQCRGSACCRAVAAAFDTPSALCQVPYPAGPAVAQDPSGLLSRHRCKISNCTDQTYAVEHSILAQLAEFCVSTVSINTVQRCYWPFFHALARDAAVGLWGTPPYLPPSGACLEGATTISSLLTVPSLADFVMSDCLNSAFWSLYRTSIKRWHF